MTLARPTRFTLWALLILLIAGGVVALIMDFDKPALGGYFKEIVGFATEVRLYKILYDAPIVEGHCEARKLLITDKSRIQSLFGGIELEGKKPCACIHSEFVVVVSPKGKCFVSLCDHCFDISDGPNGAGYHMPADFYQAYRKVWQNPTSMPNSDHEVWKEATPHK